MHNSTSSSFFKTLNELDAGLSTADHTGHTKGHLLKTHIVGAGLSGLLLANKLAGQREVVVTDKGRGVGGRLATRRTNQAKFDHGAQFYRPKDELLRLFHQRWLERGISKHWFTNDDGEHYCAVNGMTALAKDLASGLTVALNERLVSVFFENGKWISSFESGLVQTSDELVLTCPVPQSIDILRASGITVPPSLNSLRYSKALVVLIENSLTSFTFKKFGYIEPKHDVVFSVADQKAKGLSPVPALTVTLNESFSEKAFDSDDGSVFKETIKALDDLSPGFVAGSMQLKKWRYCKIIESFETSFIEIQKGLYLAGDAFGGASLNGASRSASALATHLGC